MWLRMIVFDLQVDVITADCLWPAGWCDYGWLCLTCRSAVNRCDYGWLSLTCRLMWLRLIVFDLQVDVITADCLWPAGWCDYGWLCLTCRLIWLRLIVFDLQVDLITADCLWPAGWFDCGWLSLTCRLQRQSEDQDVTLVLMFYQSVKSLLLAMKWVSKH